MSEKLASLKKIGGGKRSDSGMLPYSLSTTTKITLGYKPKFVEIQRCKDATHWAIDTYNADVSQSIQFLGVMNGTSKSSATYSVPGTTGATIASIDNDGFTMNVFTSAAVTTYGTPRYIAVEE